MNFYDWSMSHGYADNLTIDRINNDGNYEPSNCRWTTVYEQNKNRSCSLLVTYKGKTKTIMEWIKTLKLDIPYITINKRLLTYGYSVEDVLLYTNTPIRKGKKKQ